MDGFISPAPWIRELPPKINAGTVFEPAREIRSDGLQTTFRKLAYGLKYILTHPMPAVRRLAPAAVLALISCASGAGMGEQRNPNRELFPPPARTVAAEIEGNERKNGQKPDASVAEQKSTSTPFPTASPTETPPPAATETPAPTATATPWWSSENPAVREKEIDKWIKNLNYVGYPGVNDADINKFNEVFRYLKYVKNTHTLPEWAKFPFPVDNPLRFLANVKKIHVNRDLRPWGGNQIDPSVRLNPTFPNYNNFSSETLWVIQAGWLMKEASYNTWHKEALRSVGVHDSYTDWVTHWFYIVTLEDILDAREDNRFVISDPRVRQEIYTKISDYKRTLNDKAAERGWK